MPKSKNIISYIVEAAASHPEKPCVVEGTGASITYGELNSQSEALARLLSARGVVKGDRVCVLLPKSIASVVAFIGIMKAGAAYVPIDFFGPEDRARKIISGCQPRILIAKEDKASAFADIGIPVLSDPDLFHPEPGRAPLPDVEPTDLAYILHTSGSTGVPKGVMITHANASSFVEWCSSEFALSSEDRFSSHAPFHFDLSIFDLYVCFKHKAEVRLVPEGTSKSPRDLAEFISRNKITVWYSTPTALKMLVQFGEIRNKSFELKLVLFAGEVYPISPLKELRAAWPKPAFYNLYGPTETNVCTFFKIPEKIPEERDTPYPIGHLCSHCQGLVMDESHSEANEGLLYISGESVFAGYWNRPEETDKAFLERDGKRWYNTGDVVRKDSLDGYVYLGRKDRMVKRRGYRIELGEIERALSLHPQVLETAAVSLETGDGEQSIVAFVAGRAKRVSVVEAKAFLSQRIPTYMIPDKIVGLDALPKTSTDKIDLQSLKKLAEQNDER